jgi:hypothetical protein
MEAETMTSELDGAPLTEEQKLEAELALVEEAKANLAREAAFDSLARSIESRFYQRASRRKTKESEWMKAMELYLGNLLTSTSTSSEMPFAGTNSSSRPYYNIIASKCDIAIAQSVDMQFAGGEKNWSLTASPNNRDPANAERARLMEKEIETQLERCSYGKKTRRAIEDRVILGTGVLKGPVNTGRVYTTYAPVPGTDIWAPKPGVDKSPAIEWVNPWFFFPDDSVNEFSQVGDTIEVHPSSAMELKKWRFHPGFIRDAVDEVLKTKPEEYMMQVYTDYSSITDTNPYLFKEKYMVLEYHGPISADDLALLSIEAPAYDPINEEYYGEVWVCAGKVIRIELENIEASFEVPYAVSTWKKDPASVFGFGSPLLMKDSQRVAREVWRMVLDNASLSSGPQLAMHRTYVEPQDGKWELAPNKAWNLLDASIDVQKAIQFFNVPNMTTELLPILDVARGMAEEESMMPMISAGLGGADVQESASGSLMMREAATTIVDFLSEDWDDNVTEKIIRRTYGWNMQYNPLADIKGEYTVDVRTATEFKNKQMYLRDLERLSMEVTQNPEAGMLVNKEELFRARMAVMKIPYGAIIRSDEEIAQLKAAQAAQPSPESMEMKLKQQELALEERSIALKEKMLEFEKAQQQAREVMDHQERMSANRARELEAMAAVTRTQNEKDTQFLQLAQKMESEKEKRALLARIAVTNNETKRFAAQLDSNAKARQHILTAEEMRLKATTGSGI